MAELFASAYVTNLICAAGGPILCLTHSSSNCGKWAPVLKIFANGGQSPVFAMNLATFAIWESRADVRMSKAIRAGLEELVFFRTLRANPSLVVS